MRRAPPDRSKTVMHTNVYKPCGKFNLSDGQLCRASFHGHFVGPRPDSYADTVIEHPHSRARAFVENCVSHNRARPAGKPLSSGNFHAEEKKQEPHPITLHHLQIKLGQPHAEIIAYVNSVESQRPTTLLDVRYADRLESARRFSRCSQKSCVVQGGQRSLAESQRNPRTAFRRNCLSACQQSRSHPAASI